MKKKKYYEPFGQSINFYESRSVVSRGTPQTTDNTKPCVGDGYKNVVESEMSSTK